LELSSLPVPLENIDFQPYPKDAFYADMMRVSQGLAEKHWSEVIVNKSLAAMYWLKEQGVKFELDNIVTKGDRILVGQENIIRNVNLGEGLVEMLYSTAEAKKIPILYETAARSLIVDADGGVCGVIAKSKEGLIKINSKSVILACGGLEASVEMRRRYLGEGWDLAKNRGTRYNTGDGLRMALEIGAQSHGHWGGCHASVVSEDSPQVEAETVGCIRYSYLYCIMVNINGERFLDEGEDMVAFTYAKIGRQIAAQPTGVAFQIFDAKVTPYLLPEYQGATRVEADSIESLADQAGIDVEGLVNTVNQFNQAVCDDKPFMYGIRDGRRTKGIKPEKTNWAQKIDTPPFLAYAVVRGLTFAYGGLKINDKTQVIDTSDQPIDGLYAVGELPGGLFYHNYASGSGLMKGTITGRTAAAEAAARAAKR